MRYRRLGKCGIEVSEISFGAWAIGGTSETLGVSWGWSNVNEQDSIAAIHRARELGVNFFDTADVYGNGRSEQVLAKALSSDWKSVFVASKCGNVTRNGQFAKDWSKQHITWSCEQSLKRLNKDVIDLYQLHNPDVESIEKGDWPETMELLRQQGKIRWFGVSVFLPEEAMAVLHRGAGHTIQLAYNALRQEMEADVFPLAIQKDFGIIARVPLYYGILTGKYKPDTTFPPDDHRSHTLPPETMRELASRAARIQEVAQKDAGDSFSQWSLRFAISHPAVSTAIAGARNAKQAGENFKDSGGPLAAPPLDVVRKMWQQDPYLRELRTGL